MKIEKPLANEYANFYQGYVEQVGDAPVLDYISDQSERFISYLKDLPEDQMSYRYQEDKWVTAEVIGHIIDTERIMAYRILRISRGDKTPIPGFDEKDYVKYSTFASRSKASLIREFEALRSSNLELIMNLTEEQSTFTGESNGSIFSVRAFVYILAGHVAHHWQILRERYGLN
ncbi:MAG: DinB family protein [Marinoscillum sp.]